MVYNYNLYNNHIVTTIDNKNYLIDSGSFNSFWTYSPIKEVIINDKPYQLSNKPKLLDLEEMERLVGAKIDGFIGMDILSKTSLTIRKHTQTSGELIFSAEEGHGDGVSINKFYLPSIQVECSNYSGRIVIDTGARYAYILNKELVDGQKPSSGIEDYNPLLGRLSSGMYRLNVGIGNKSRELDVCFNKKIYRAFGSDKGENEPILITGIMSLFDNVCVIDLQKRMLILD